MKAWQVGIAGAVAGAAIGYQFYQPGIGDLGLFGEMVLTSAALGILGFGVGLGCRLVKWATSKVR